MPDKLVLLSLFFLLSFTVNAQNLSLHGVVKNDKGEPLSSATLQLKNAENLDLISYGFTDQQGSYTLYIVQGNSKEYLLIATYLGFRKDTLRIKSKILSNIEHDFKLQPDENQLNEINIKSPLPLITTVNDTTKYTVAGFTSPDDRNLESVIKKMPGMEVSADGTIFFKRRKISKVLLENDDLTGENYKSITQSLKPELVAEVQAVSNWVEDDLLKGIINSDDVVLNLTLKDKRAKKIIGSIDAGYGDNDRREIAANLIGMSGKTKSYLSLGNNNIGLSKENDFSLAGADKKMNGRDGLIHHAVNAYNPFNNGAYALNNSSSGTLSTVTRATPKFKLTTSVYGMINKLSGESLASSIYYAPINATLINQQNQQSTNKLFQGELIANYLATENSRLTANFSYKVRPAEFNSLAVSSYNSISRDEISQVQKDDLRNYNADLKYTWKLSPNAAVIINGKINSATVDQNYEVNSLLYGTIPSFNGFTTLLQKVYTSNNRFNFDIQALKKTGRSYLYGNIGTEYTGTKLQSGLSSGATMDSIAGFSNRNVFNSSRSYAAGQYSFKGERFNFRALLRGVIVNQQGYQTDSTFFVFEPEVNAALKITDKQLASLSYNFKNTMANPMDYYDQQVLTDFRSVSTGLDRLYNFGNHTINISYDNRELEDRYFSFNLYTNFQSANGGFLTNNFFENTIYYTQKRPYKGIKTVSGGFGLKKFLPLIATNISISYSPSISSYYAEVLNQVNKFSSVTQLLDIKAGTGFKLPINFNLGLQYQNNKTNLEGTSINNQDSYKYYLQARSNISKTLYHLIDFNWYKIGRQNYQLLHTQLQYNPLKGKFKYAILGKNILNVRSITNIDVDNTGERFYSSRILGRYFMGSIAMAIK